jgi:hypothetical protein
MIDSGGVAVGAGDGESEQVADQRPDVRDGQRERRELPATDPAELAKIAHNFDDPAVEDIIDLGPAGSEVAP